MLVGTLLIVAILGNMQWELVRHGWTGGIAGDGAGLSPDNHQALAKARSVAMVTQVLGQTTYVFSCRYFKTTSLRADILTGNPLGPLVALVNIGLQCLLVYTPALQAVFELGAIDVVAWVRCVTLACAVFLLAEADKVLGPLVVHWARRQWAARRWCPATRRGH